MNKKSLFSLLLSSVLLLTFCSAVPAHAAASWNVQTVDPNAAGRGSNGYCPIVLDSNNVPSIAYTRSNSSDYLLWYARWNSSLGGFNIQQITTGAATGIALDSNNNPNILCGELRVGFKDVSWTGLNWTIQIVDTLWAVYAALALDSAGNPHVAYSTGQTLKYASRSGSTWTIEIVDNGTDIPLQLSLALDSNDKPHILYSNSALKLATLENSGWKIEAISLPDQISGVGNMVLDSKGHPNLVYSIGISAHTTIKYARWNGFSWKTQTVASGVLDDFRFPGVLALDSLDYPHISFVSGDQLMYAGWTGVDWNIQTADSTAGVRNPLYMAVDSNRIPHISYRIGSINDNTNNLMYATATEPVPLSPPTSAFPLLLVVAAVVIGVAVVAVVVYVWKKKTKH